MNRRQSYICTLFVVALVVATLTDSLDAQLFGSGKDQPRTKFIPRSAFATVAVFPQKVASNPDFRLFPREIVTAWGKKELGFDPMLIKEITFSVKTPDSYPLDQEPGWAAVLDFEKMQGLSGNMIDRLQATKVGGKTVYDGTEMNVPSFLIFDESTIVIGNAAYFEEVVTADGGGYLVELIKSNNVDGQLQAFVNLEPVRLVINDMLRELDEFELPPAVENLKQLPNLIDSFEFGLNTEGTLETRIVIHARNADSAVRVQEIMQTAMTYAKNAMLVQMTAEFDTSDPVQAATIAYSKRIAEKFETKLSPEISGSDLTIIVHEELLAAPFLLGMMGARTATMDFKRRMTPENQLRQTALAFHNYADAYGKFPPRTIKDENGRELFSGRVAMLPFMEQVNLYQSLKLDEPWDSPHNSEFTSMAIESFGITADGLSTLRFPVYPNSLWDGEGELTFRNITDGTSNTIFAIHAPEDAAVSWADPQPWKISTTDPMRDVFGDRDEVIVALLDGSTVKLERAEMTNEKLKAMLTISGGEIVEF